MFLPQLVMCNLENKTTHGKGLLKESGGQGSNSVHLLQIINSYIMYLSNPTYSVYYV
jgi:hypothetical protein